VVFKEWDQKDHAQDYLLFPENIGPKLSIDEVSLTNGELFTFITNKDGHGKNGTLVASIKGTLSKDISKIMELIPLEKRNTVKEITLDMARNMESAALKSFPKSKLVTDRFHVVKLVLDALQHLRITHRWNEIDQENKAIAIAKANKVKYKSVTLKNGDTPKQLLARSRYILSKKKSKWTPNQVNRATILFSRYPDLKITYDHVMEFRKIYELKKREEASIKINSWIEKTKKLAVKEFNTAANTISYNLDNILNFFDNRSTNASAESFNAKIKLFRANQRGVVDTTFFLFRLYKLFA
jgi:transposase